VGEKLGKYRAKRDFETTPEPAGGGGEDAPSARFVVQEHHARRLHWDLRLERDGVLVSWAVPKGIPFDPKHNRLAVHVEDHPLEYIDFAGEIPKGEYGAGKVAIWDSGTYECHKFRPDEVIVTFHGERVKGRYVLFQTEGENWMIHRMDPPADPARDPMPEELVPMLAKLGSLPRRQADYAYEVKWDGVRAILYAEGGRTRLQSRTMRDITAQYPEIGRLGRELGSRECVLDGEVVALDEQGRPSFGRLQGRMHLGSESAVRRKMQAVPVTYMAFDLVYLEGHSTMGLGYVERRALLSELGLSGAHWQTPDYVEGNGEGMLRASREHGLEGIVAKRLDSRYEPGRRSGAWIKVKNLHSQPLVVGGWMPGEGSRAGKVGALLVGYWDCTPGEAAERGEAQRLVYAGRVGTGFKEADLKRLAELLEPLRRGTSPFDGRQPPKAAVLCEPELVAEVEFREWTHTGTLRAPSFKGLRDDLDVRQVVRELNA
jgi:DNA ligase D-like protein (predicted ligase)/DNA ligase D-like protein (predicted 3'-phosphoesterase)